LHWDRVGRTTLTEAEHDRSQLGCGGGPDPKPGGRRSTPAAIRKVQHGLGRARRVNEHLRRFEPRPRRPAHDTIGRHQSTPARGISPDQPACSEIRRGQPTPPDARVSDLLIRGLDPRRSVMRRCVRDVEHGVVVEESEGALRKSVRVCRHHVRRNLCAARWWTCSVVDHCRVAAGCELRGAGATWVGLGVGAGACQAGIPGDATGNPRVLATSSILLS
jgi:hypothetical protein